MNEFRLMSCRLIPALLVAGILGLAAGCATSRTTNTARSATEQLLLCYAADRAMAAVKLPEVADKKVFVDVANLECVDKGYIVNSVREAVGAHHGLLAPDAASADCVVEVRSGTFATNQAEGLVGIPSMKIPIPMAGTIESPEIALYKRASQRGVARFALHGVDRKTGGTLFTTGTLTGGAIYNHWVVLFVPFSTTDVLELK